MPSIVSCKKALCSSNGERSASLYTKGVFSGVVSVAIKNLPKKFRGVPLSLSSVVQGSKKVKSYSNVCGKLTL